MRAPPIILVTCFLLSAAACGPAAPPSGKIPPAHAEAVTNEANLLTITLTEAAGQRLAIATATARAGQQPRLRRSSGEIVAPPLGSNGVPIDASRGFAAMIGQQATADGDVARAQAAVTLAQLAYDRAAALAADEAGSLRARDEAAAARSIAEAALTVARAQRALLGGPVGSLNAGAAVWVRVPVFATDAGRLASRRLAEVRPLGDTGPARLASPVEAPPSASFAAGTVDTYYVADNRDHRFRIGQRVDVALPLAGEDGGIEVPASAIVRDIHGGEWVYRVVQPRQYRRSRVEVVHRDGDQVLLGRGLAAGDEIVSVGAAELFGSEFGAGH